FAHLDQPVGRYPLCLPFQLEWLDLFDLDGVADETVSGVSKQNFRSRRSLLEPCCGVDRVTGDEALPGRRVACDDLAGVHAGPVADCDSPPFLQLGVQRGEAIPHLRGSANRAEGVVFVDARETEDRHDRIADVFLDSAAVAFERASHLVEVTRHDLADCLRVELLPHRGRALEVGEHDRDGLSDLLRGQFGCKRGPAEAAKAELCRILLAATWANLHKKKSRDAGRPNRMRALGRAAPKKRALRSYSSSLRSAVARSLISSTTVGSASVVVSPSLRFSETSRSSRRMIFPDRVFGNSGVKTMFAG